MQVEIVTKFALIIQFQQISTSAAVNKTIASCSTENQPDEIIYMTNIMYKLFSKSLN